MGGFKFNTAQRTLVCAILNITPDSFSDGGLWNSPERALERALEMQEQGADIIDVGAQSTRPGARVLSAQDELDRLEPVLDRLCGRIGVPLSVDTFYPACARAALARGADIVNDVSGEVCPDMARVVREFDAGWIIMHNPPQSQTVIYERGVTDHVRSFFEFAADRAQSLGIALDSLCFDVGIGFAKSYEENLLLIRDIGKTRVRGAALMCAASRKRVIGQAGGQSEPARRDPGTVAAHTISVMGGADVIRAHDVFSAVQAAGVADAVLRVCGRDGRPREK